MDSFSQPSGSPRTFFDAIPSRTAFWLGFITALLTIGTLGFIILGSCVLKGGCSAANFAAVVNSEKNEAVKTQPTATTPTTTATSLPVVSESDHVRGAESAKITIIEYSDFQCPYCSRFHPTLQQAMTEYEGKIRWVLRHFPLSFHPEAEPAAEAAECAAEQGKFWEYADALFANQSSLSADYYKTLASSLGLKATDFETCLNSDKYLDKIRSQAQGGAEAGVTGTPGTFIVDQDGNAVPIKGALPYSSVSAAIESLL